MVVFGTLDDSRDLLTVGCMGKMRLDIFFGLFVLPHLLGLPHLSHSSLQITLPKNDPPSSQPFITQTKTHKNTQTLTNNSRTRNTH